MQHLPYNRLVWLVLSICLPNSLCAQLPPGQPEQDCLGAIPVCQEVVSQANIYVGQGQSPNEINVASSCFVNGEQNSTWYVVNPQSDGLLGFVINPVDPLDDFDWGVWDLSNANCSEIFSDANLQLSCNSSIGGGPTGPNGQGGSQFGAPVAVVAGGTYVINVNSLNRANAGYSLDFTSSTAQIVDTEAPVVSQADFNCTAAGIEIVFSEHIACNSLSESAFTLSGPGGPYVIDAVSCNSGGAYGKVAILTTTPAITSSGQFSLGINGGVTDLCGNAIAPSATDFVISTVVQDVAITSPSNELCEGDAVLLSTNLSGQGNFNFLWMPGNLTAPTISVTPTDTTLYTVVVTGPSLCNPTRDDFQVNVNPRPVADAGIDREFCEGMPGVTLNGGPAATNEAPLPFSYKWFPSDGLSNDELANPFALPTTTTSYTVQVTSTNGCTSNVQPSDENTVQVRVKSSPVVTVGNDTTICTGDTLELAAIVAGGGTDFLYSWTPLTTGYMSAPDSLVTRASPNFSTVYFFTASSDGCLGRADSILVTVEATPTLSAGPDRAICLGDTLQLEGLALGDPTATLFRYSWSPSLGISDPRIAQPLARPDTTTTYKLQATSNFGCGSGIDSVTITVSSTPIAEILTPDTTICAGDTLGLRAEANFTTTLPGSPLTFIWAPATAIQGSAFDDQIDAVPNSNTTYTVTTSIAGNCPTVDSVRINVVPNVQAVASADTNRVCAGDSIQLLGLQVPGATYEWSPPIFLSDPESSSPIAFPDTSTTYTLRVSNSACSDSMDVDIEIIPIPNSDYLFSSNEGCVGLEVSFFADDAVPTAYIWDFGDGSPISNEQNPVHAFTQQGSYPVQLTTVGAYGCSSTSFSTTVTVSDSAFADFSSSPPPGSNLVLPISNVIFTDQSQNGNKWLWDFGDGQSSTEISPSYTYKEEGSYVVRLLVTDENECVSIVSYGPYTIIAPELFIPNVFSPNDDAVNDEYIVRYTGTDSFDLFITDRWGRPHFKGDSPSSGWNGLDINGELSPEGVYYYRLQIGEKSFHGNITLLR